MKTRKIRGYVDSFIRTRVFIPGQNGFKNIGDGKGFDFSYSSSRLVYLAGKHVMFDLGYERILLETVTGRCCFLTGRLIIRTCTALTFGKFQYNMMWSQYISERSSNTIIRPGILENGRTHI